MYQTLMKDIEVSMQPVFILAEIQQSMLEKMHSIRTECIGDCFNAGIKQYEALSDVSSPIAATELQMKFLQDFSSKMMNTAELNMQALEEAGESVNKVFDESFKALTMKNPIKDYFDFEITAFVPTPAVATPSKPKAVVAAAPAAKPVAKAPARKAPAKKAAPKAAAKTTTAKTTTAKTATAKAAPAKTTTAKKTTRAKAPAAKPVASKAAPKTAAAKTTASKPAAKAAPAPSAGSNGAAKPEA